MVSTLYQKAISLTIGVSLFALTSSCSLRTSPIVSYTPNDLATIQRRIMEKGEYRRSTLGMRALDLDPKDISDEFDDNDIAVLITNRLGGILCSAVSLDPDNTVENMIRAFDAYRDGRNRDDRGPLDGLVDKGKHMGQLGREKPLEPGDTSVGDFYTSVNFPSKFFNFQGFYEGCLFAGEKALQKLR